MITVKNSFYKDYEYLLIKNDKLSQEIRDLKYLQKLADNQIKYLLSNEQKAKDKNYQLQQDKNNDKD